MHYRLVIVQGVRVDRLIQERLLLVRRGIFLALIAWLNHVAVVELATARTLLWLGWEFVPYLLQLLSLPSIALQLRLNVLKAWSILHRLLRLILGLLVLLLMVCWVDTKLGRLLKLRSLRWYCCFLIVGWFVLKRMSGSGFMERSLCFLFRLLLFLVGWLCSLLINHRWPSRNLRFRLINHLPLSLFIRRLLEWCWLVGLSIKLLESWQLLLIVLTSWRFVMLLSLACR